MKNTLELQTVCRGYCVTQVWIIVFFLVLRMNIVLVWSSKIRRNWKDVDTGAKKEYLVLSLDAIDASTGERYVAYCDLNKYDTVWFKPSKEFF